METEQAPVDEVAKANVVPDLFFFSFSPARNGWGAFEEKEMVQRE